MSDRKLSGCCTVCDQPIFEVVARHADGPYQGEIKTVGLPIPGSRRVHIVRASGRQSYWSLCESCTIAPSDFPELNRKEIRAMIKERSYATDTMKQAEHREKMLRLFQWDIPIGVLGEKPWTEVR